MFQTTDRQFCNIYIREIEIKLGLRYIMIVAKKNIPNNQIVNNTNLKSQCTSYYDDGLVQLATSSRS